MEVKKRQLLHVLQIQQSQFQSSQPSSTSTKATPIKYTSFAYTSVYHTHTHICSFATQQCALFYTCMYVCTPLAMQCATIVWMCVCIVMLWCYSLPFLWKIKYVCISYVLPFSHTISTSRVVPFYTHTYTQYIQYNSQVETEYGIRRKVCLADCLNVFLPMKLFYGICANANFSYFFNYFFLSYQHKIRANYFLSIQKNCIILIWDRNYKVWDLWWPL